MLSAEGNKPAGIEIGPAQTKSIYKHTKGYSEVLDAATVERNLNAVEPIPVPENFDDIVFEKRNQEYGAYVLRKAYLPNVYFGLIVTLIITVLVLSSPLIIGWFKGEEELAPIPVRKLVYSELSAPPPIDKMKPPPPQIQLPRLQKVIKFVPPRVVRENVSESAPTIEEIRQNETAAVAVEGTEVVFDEPAPEIVVDDNELFTVVEQNPEFAGGYAAMVSFIKQNMVYPAMARRMEQEGTVHVSFIVSKSGTISDVQILRGISAELDKEAIRVIQLMPPWTPGKQNGRPVNVRFVMPFKFRMKA
jgi:periplasmic protein TonB